jgi:hypothetical protein
MISLRLTSRRESRGDARIMTDRSDEAPLLSQLRLRHVAALALVLAAAATVLRAMGRPWWCLAGDPALWSGDVWSRHNSQHLVDPYAFTHVLHGVAFYGLLWLLFRGSASPLARFAIGTAVEVGWEIVENTNAMIDRYRSVTISLGYSGDSVANSLGDVSSFVLGYLAASALPVAVSAAGFFLVDAILVWWIRDSLLLNVLMLVHPIDVIKAWQSAGIPGAR